MFSGYLQAGLYKGLNGTAGLAGWQWLFIFDGIIGIPIAIWGYWAIPDLPNNTRAFWLNQEVSFWGSSLFAVAEILISSSNASTE